MKKHNLAFVDTETTGLDFDKHEIISIGCVIASQDWSSGKLKLTQLDEFEIKIKPTHIETADPQALRVNGYNETDWIYAYSLAEAMTEFSKKTKDCIFISHNLSFDAAFMDKAFKQTGVPNSMHYPRIDTISLAFAKLHNTEDLRYSLHSLCEHFGIKNSNAHTALADTRALFEIYQKLMLL
mgnify:FL=1